MAEPLTWAVAFGMPHALRCGECFGAIKRVPQDAFACVKCGASYSRAEAAEGALRMREAQRAAQLRKLVNA